MIRVFAILLMISNLIFAQMQGPKIILPADTYDFGTVKQGEIVKHTFPIVNGGDDTLKIISVNPSCGCTAFDLPKKELFPGETVLLAVQFNSAGKSGSQSKVVSIASNDKKNGMIRVFIKGNVSLDSVIVEERKAPKLEMPEVQHEFGVADAGTLLTYTFKLKNVGKEDLEIKEIKTSCGCTAAMPSSKLLKADEEGTLKVEFDTTNRSGKVNRTITLTTNDPDAPTRVLTIYADITKREK